MWHSSAHRKSQPLARPPKSLPGTTVSSLLLTVSLHIPCDLAKLRMVFRHLHDFCLRAFVLMFHYRPGLLFFLLYVFLFIPQGLAYRLILPQQEALPDLPAGSPLPSWSPESVNIIWFLSFISVWEAYRCTLYWLGALHSYWLGLNPTSAAYQLYDFGQVTYSPCVSVFSLNGSSERTTSLCCLGN
jgi:hypothetical protein